MKHTPEDCGCYTVCAYLGWSHYHTQPQCEKKTEHTQRPCCSVVFKHGALPTKNTKYCSTSVLKWTKPNPFLTAACNISGFRVTSVCVWLLLSSLQSFTRSSAPTAILRVWWASATAASNVIITSSVRTASGGGMLVVPIATSTKWRSIRHG